MTKLNQIIAIEKGVRNKTTRTVTDVHRLVQQDQPLSGLTRVYQPNEDGGEELPSESTRVQFTVAQANRKLADALTRLFDVTATRDYTNSQAEADVVVDGQTLLSNAPVSYLLFLEKELTNVRTFVAKLPTLDLAFKWTPDPTAGEGVFRADPVTTVRNKKTIHVLSLAKATDKHPEQTTTYTSDDPVGTWTATRFSGAIRQERKEELLDRVDKLIEAVKFAREEANGTLVEDIAVGEDIFDYLFA